MSIAESFLHYEESYCDSTVPCHLKHRSETKKAAEYLIIEAVLNVNQY